MKNDVRDKQRSIDLQKQQIERVSQSMSAAVTKKEVKDVINSEDVVNILCGPLETKIRQLELQLRQEKLEHEKTKR
jgi:hypothetical protein